MYGHTDGTIAALHVYYISSATLLKAMIGRYVFDFSSKTTEWIPRKLYWKPVYTNYFYDTSVIFSHFTISYICIYGTFHKSDLICIGHWPAFLCNWHRLEGSEATEYWASSWFWNWTRAHRFDKILLETSNTSCRITHTESSMLSFGQCVISY